MAASPLAPGIAGFDDLAKASRVTGVDGAEVGFLGTELREPVPLDRLPPHVSQAVLAAEDSRFYDHSGVDPAAVFAALRDNVLRRTSRGGSTITQQLAKLNYTGSQRTYLRKLKEVMYASKLEDKYSKDELLERYLNQVYFGEGAYGIGLASEAFFGVPPERLTPSQAAFLAGKIRAPNALDPRTDPGAVRERRDQVLRNMERQGWLSGADRATAVAAPVDVVPRAPGLTGVAANSRAPHFLSFVAREAGGIDALGVTPEARTGQVFTGGYTIETTLDLKALEAAEAAVKQQLGQPGDPTTAVVSVQPGDGAVRVLFGGLDPKLEFDPASQGRRQPGSSFKPYLYLAMLKAGMDPRATYDSGSPQTLNCKGSSWQVRNYEGGGSGPAAVDPAMADSINTVFAQIMVKVGPQGMQEVAEKAGIAHENVSPPECAMALAEAAQGHGALRRSELLLADPGLLGHVPHRPGADLGHELGEDDVDRPGHGIVDVDHPPALALEVVDRPGRVGAPKVLGRPGVQLRAGVDTGPQHGQVHIGLERGPGLAEALARRVEFEVGVEAAEQHPDGAVARLY